ncbi:hypothetical protein PCL_00986 [Purpureocillium lilacinum]|uniref:Fungal specific transcription factor domain-containing protein n=1 Tax=Purpureocillium lilacinum TaxID=33203 RepID=A0A2U3E4C0_PURLI|nr:hypothetical protein PCL_00986 [Purpureocillium lilacinum]
MGLTFVILTDAPALDASASRRMRAHVTKTNFAKRRQRIAKQLRLVAEAPETERKFLVANCESSDLVAGLHPDAAPHLLQRPTDPDRAIQFLLHKYRALVFPAYPSYRGTAVESQWTALLISEPALLEASMAIGVRHQASPSARESIWHAYRAVNLVNKRLNARPPDLGDGVIAAVFTLAYSESLVPDEPARNVHLAGLAQMIKVRRSLDQKAMAPWFTQFLLYASISEHVSSCSGRDSQLALSLGDVNSEACLATIGSIASSLDQLRHSLNDFGRQPTAPEVINEFVLQPISSVQESLQALPRAGSLYLQSLSCAIRIFLQLLWPACAVIDTPVLANELREMLNTPRLRLCASINLTVWQFFVGAVAAPRGSETRHWFAERLKRMLISMGVVDWKGAVLVLCRGFMPSDLLLQDFRALWEDFCMQR